MTNAGHGIRPENMCRQHLNSCHGEIHQEKAYIEKYGFRSAHIGHLKLGQIIPEFFTGRHEELAHEIDFRAKQSRSAGGHKSGVDCFNGLDTGLIVGPFPLKALQLYQRNVFRCKSCSCLQ